MAYRKGSGDRSRGRRLRAKSKERKAIRESLANLEFAKQAETRSREGHGNTAALTAAAIAGFGFGIWDPKLMAAAIAGGKGVGDFAYVKKHDDENRIKDAQEALALLEDQSVFAEGRETLEDANLAALVAEENITGGDLGSGLMNFGTDWIHWYTLLSGVNKGYTVGEETVKKGFLDRLGEKIPGVFTEK